MNMLNSDALMGRLLRSVSLDALRGFESAARHLSFTAAAEELCVTQSAVSKQVKALEKITGKELFHRSSKGLGLTAEGLILREGIRRSLVQLSQVIDEVAEERRTSITVTVTPSFASLWLVSKLPRFRLEEPGIDIHLDASETVVQLERDGFDIAIRLAGDDVPPSWRTVLRERVMLVAAPQLAERIRRPEDLVHLPLLVFHDPRGRFAWMSWLRWLEKLELPQGGNRPVFHFSQYEHLIRAAIEGVGVAIGRTPLILPSLADGSLRVVLPDRAEDGMSYHLVLSRRSAQRSEVQRFAAWVERELTREAIA